MDGRLETVSTRLDCGQPHHYGRGVQRRFFPSAGHSPEPICTDFLEQSREFLCGPNPELNQCL